MRRLLRPILLPLLRRNPREIERRARRFRIASEEGRALVARLGEAFLGGYNAMLVARGPREVCEEGLRVPPHFRPFFFEGAAMGYLPRGWLSPGFGPEAAERTLLSMHPRFLYLYYVGLGFWYGFRHPRRPAAIEELAGHLDPRHAPLCYDGFGFKTAFFDFPARPSARDVLESGPEAHRFVLYQGFGRGLFFVHMDDPEGFEAVSRSIPPEHRDDLEFGRSLALAFTGIDRPGGIVEHLARARDERVRAPRLLGVTWALTAREMTDPAYYAECMERVPLESRPALRRLPEICRAAFEGARSYREWQERTREETLRAWPTVRGAVG